MPSREEWIAALREGVDGFRALRQDHQEDPNLTNANLRGRHLREAPLDRVNLAGADLREADLAGANLGFADLTKADLRGANLVDATLHRAILTGADLRDCHLGGFNARGRLCLHEGSFRGVRWGKEELKTLLAVLNTNEDWEIRYEIVPRSGVTA